MVGGGGDGEAISGAAACCVLRTGPATHTNIVPDLNETRWWGVAAATGSASAVLLRAARGAAPHTCGCRAGDRRARRRARLSLVDVVGELEVVGGDGLQKRRFAAAVAADQAVAPPVRELQVCVFD